MIDTLKAKGSDPICLELGDFMDDNPRKGPVINAFLLDTMESEGVPAMIPGVTELTQWNRFLALMEGRSIALISSNLEVIDARGPRPVGRRTLILEHDGVRIGLIGIMGESQFAMVTAPPEVSFQFQDPNVVVTELAASLRDSVDLIVVMASLDDRDAMKFARPRTDIDVLLGGYESIASAWPLMSGEVIVSRSGMRGQFFSVTRLILSPENEIIDWGGRNLLLTKQVAPDHPEMAMLVADAEERARTARMPTRRAQQRTQMTAVSDSVRFVGVEYCQLCHTAQHAQWLETRHATAYRRLIQNDKAGDPTCVGCHVTGLGQRSGFVLAERTRRMQGVQCEACHGPASEHRRDGTRSKVSEALCLKCHTNDWTPEWNFGAMRAKVVH